jgi:ribosomal protein S12 methylthiotransferase
MREQQKISKRINESFAGKQTEALIYDKINDGVYLARTYRDAPDIDGGMVILSDKVLTVGEYYNCLVTGADEYTLQGTVL